MDRTLLLARIASVRGATERLVEGLDPEDCLVQSMPEASPLKWHLAHTTWFFETFVLEPFAGSEPLDPAWAFLFNSYYDALGPRQPRARRGDLSRPYLREVMAWRQAVNERLAAWVLSADDAQLAAAFSAIDLGLHHEQQHQELMLTDLKHHLWSNPLRPAYRAAVQDHGPVAEPLRWTAFEAGLVDTGFDGDGFAFDNECPRHPTWLGPYTLADRLVTCGEWIAFLEDGGYQRPALWLADGWAWRQCDSIEAPLYWEAGEDGRFSLFTLAGVRAVDPHEPIAHVSLYEADAFARWAGARLPREAEWERAFADAATSGANLAETGHHHPRRAPAGQGLRQGFGDVWEWTASSYAPYPGYAAPEGALGEYNGKFMANQMVLRGGSCATPQRHVRPTYRNFFYPKDRWQFVGVRLARDV